MSESAVTTECPVIRQPVTRLFIAVVNMWRASDSKKSWVGFCFWAVLLGMFAVEWTTGAVPTFIYGHDNFFFLENGWRVLNGLRPHLDFWSPWGPVMFLATGLGLKLSHYNASGIAHGSAIVSLALGVWAYFLGDGRLAVLPRMLLGIYVAALAGSPQPIGSSPLWLSPAMLYNRYGYALLVLVLTESFQRRLGKSSAAHELIGGVSTGAALAISLFLKASFFLAGFGILAVSLVLWFPSLRRLLGCVAGFVGISLVFLAYLRFDLGSVLRALIAGAAARAQSLSIQTVLHATTAQSLPLACGLAFAIVAVFLERHHEWLGELYLPISAVIVLIADIGLRSTNAQGAGLPLLATFALLVADRLSNPRFDSALGDRFFIPYSTALLLLAALLFLPQFTSDVMAVPVAAMRKLHLPSGCSARFTEPRVADLILCENPTDAPANGSNYVNYINDGIALLRQNGQPGAKVLTMDMQNPFPYVLGWPPPRGGMAATAFNYSFSAQFRPSFDQYFGDATVVMVPKYPALDRKYFDGFYDIYGPEMQKRFKLTAESDWFSLYTRR